MAYQPFKLRQTIKVHTNDVRAVSFVNNDLVLTTSRDGSAKLSTPEGLTTDLLSGAAFINSCATKGDYAYVGAIDGTITEISLKSGELRYYIGHSGNVSSLAVAANKLVSGSWDTTVRVWDTDGPGDVSVVLEGHTQYVWDAQFVDENTVVSASADRTIRVWDVHTKQTRLTLSGHTDVVRSLLVMSPDTLLSASNDGTVKCWDLRSGQNTSTWVGHSSFVYSLARLGDDFVVSSGEDRTVRIWDTRSGKCVQTIILPSISQWAVASNELGEFVVGSSDNKARIFSPIVERQADLAEQAQFEEALKGSAIGESEINDNDVQSEDVLKSPGKQEGQVAVVRSNGRLEAHQFSNGSWFKIGDVVGANQSSGSKKETFGGKQYDYVFDVDIADGQPPLKLPFNNSDNPYEVAEKFIADNGLPPSYTEEVVKFLITNSEAKVMGAVGSGPAPTPDPAPTPTGPAASPDSVPSVLRYNQPVFIRAFQTEPLLRTLGNIAAARGDNIQVYHLDSMLSSLPSSATNLLQVSIELYGKWSDNIQNLLPVYDLLRIALADALTIPHQVVWTELLSALDAQVPKHCMLAIRGVANLVGNASFDPQVTTQTAMLGQALSMIQAVAAESASFSKPLATAFATLILNLAVRALPSVNYVALIQTAAPKVTASGDAEAMYRLLLAVGLRSVAGEGKSYHSSWFSPSERRIEDLLEVVKPRIAS